MKRVRLILSSTDETVRGDDSRRRAMRFLFSFVPLDDANPTLYAPESYRRVVWLGNVSMVTESADSYFRVR